MYLFYVCDLLLLSVLGGFAFPLLILSPGLIIVFGLPIALLWRLALSSTIGWSIPMVNGIVVISPTFVAMLVVFVYLCEFVDSRSGSSCVGLRIASRLFFDDPCNDFLQLVLGNVLDRYKVLRCEVLV